MGSANKMLPTEGILIKVLLQFQALGATSPCMGKSRLQTERYCREPLGTTTLSALKAARLCLALRLKPFEKDFKNSKTFMTKRIDFLPRVCEHCTPSVVLLIKVLLQFFASKQHQPAWGSFVYRRQNSYRKPLGATTLSALKVADSVRTCLRGF